MVKNVRKEVVGTVKMFVGKVIFSVVFNLLNPGKTGSISESESNISYVSYSFDL